MGSVVHSVIHGKPVFEAASPLRENASLLKENYVISCLTPSERIQNKILLFIDWIFVSALNWLYPFEQTNYVGIVSAFDRASMAGQMQLLTLKNEELLSYFKHFFYADEASSPEISSCVEQLQEQSKAIKQFRAAVNRGEGEAEQLKMRGVLEGWINGVENLSIGGQKLVIAHDGTGNELFYLFSRDAGGINLKVIGRGFSMIDLSGIREVALAGKVKIPATLTYRNIPVEQIRALLQFSPLANPIDTEQMRQILGGLTLQADETRSPSNLATRSDNYRKVLQTVFKQIQLNANGNRVDSSRAKLRCKVYTLFSILKEYRHSLSGHYQNIQTLDRMLHLCSQSLYVAHQKGVINQEELGSLVSELTCVKQAIDAAKSTSNNSAPFFKLPWMNFNSRVPLTTAPAHEPPAVIQQVQPTQLRNPRTEPAFAGAQIHRSLDPVAVLPASALLQVPDDANVHQIIRTVYAVDFFPYADQQNQEILEQTEFGAGFSIPPERAAAWANLTREQAVALAEKLRTLSERIAAESRHPHQVSIDAYTCLVKMTYMIGYLDREKINPDNVNHWAASQLQGLYPVETRNTDHIGFCINPQNVMTYLQLRHYAIRTDQNRSQLSERTSPQYGEEGYDEYLDRIREEGFVAESARQSEEALPYLHAQTRLFRSLRLDSASTWGLTEGWAFGEGGSEITGAWNGGIPTALAFRGARGTIDSLIGSRSSSVNGEFAPSLHGWIPTLSTSLYSAYTNLGINERGGSVLRNRFFSLLWGRLSASLSLSWDMENRASQEALSHDPQASLRTVTDLTTQNIATTREQLDVDLGLTDAPQGTVAAERLERNKQEFREQLLRQEEILLQASRLDEEFTDEEMTALLSLLRNESPQTELMAFMRTHRAMLSRPQVRSFIQLLFFNSELLALGKGNGVHALRTTAPQFLAERIQESRQLIASNPQDANEAARFLFFIQVSDSLKDIYAKVGWSTQGFFDVDALNNQITQLSNRFPSNSIAQELTAFKLKMALKQRDLSQKQLCQIILDMQSIKFHLNNASAISPLDSEWIKWNYERLLNEIFQAGRTPFSQEQLHYILDAVCQQNRLPLDRSIWRGSGFRFENDQYEIDLIKGTIIDKRSRSIHAALPAHRLADPLFQNCFPDLAKKEHIEAMLQELDDGTKVYRFEDGQHHLCQVEEKSGVYTYYRHFSELNPPRKLQAAELFSEGAVPAILKQGFFIDPGQPETGYIISDAGKLLLELELTHSSGGVQVGAVYDLRGAEKSEAMILASAHEINHSALQQLEQFECSDQILFWAEKGSWLGSFFVNAPVQKIEFPRYGLTFVLQGDRFVCQDPLYAGYAINFSATLEDRKGFAYSMVLEHPDRTRPAKLLVPKASLLVPFPNVNQPYSGLAYLIWMFRIALDSLLNQTIPLEMVRLELGIASSNQEQDLIAVDLHPQTKELLYQPGKTQEHSQELMKQAIAIGDYELAYEVLHAVPIDKNPQEIYKWTRFAQALKYNLALVKSPAAAALGLKILNRLHGLIRREEGYKEIRKQLNTSRAELFKEAMLQGKKVPASLRLNEAEFNQLSALVRKKDPTYYQMHIQPFSQRGRAILLPTVLADGTLTHVSAVAPVQQLPRNRLTRIAELETQLRPDLHVSTQDLTQTLTLIDNPSPLLFDRQTLEGYFNEQRVLNGYENQLLNRIIVPKLNEISLAHDESHANLQSLLRSENALEQLAFHAKEKRIATSTELMIALVQDDLAGLRDLGHLPAAVDLVRLKEALIHYYDLEVKLHLCKRSKEMLEGMILENEAMSPEHWKERSFALLELLEHSRHYNAEANPELLIFEAFHFMTFRDAVEPGQLQVLSAILHNPSGITQAGTGSGKTSVLSILRALKKANGRNLVTHKVLPHLYPETLALMKTRLEKTFKRKVYPLRFDLTMPQQDRQGRSVFEGMYQMMLETIQNKGCILTDYKSFPVLEEKFWSLNRELLAARAEGIQPDDLKKSHWTHLRKILILLQNKEDQLMDEFDEPNRPVHRIQVQIAGGPALRDFMIETSLDIYARLLREAPLRLAQNLQGDIASQTRTECINRVAEQIAREKADAFVTWQELKNYMLGINAQALTKIGHWTPEQKDVLAFLKDQFYTNLPLTLGQSGISKYQRSKDGKRIITCVQGEPKEAKFGNIIEEINYSIQEYLQHRVAFPTVRGWVIDAIRDFKNRVEGAEQRFREIVPTVALDQLARLSPDDLDDRIERELLPAINQRTNAVEFFLRRHLAGLRSSGFVASMNPQDAVAMSRIVAGVSATAGSLGSLHSQFQTNQNEATRIQEEMIARLRRRALGQPITYDPVNPMAILNRPFPAPLTAIIDGSGMFRENSSRSVAEALLRSNPALRKVEYYENSGALNYVGQELVPLEAKGFYFSQAYTRGADQRLRPDAVALLTVCEQGRMEDLSQQEGRMRENGQRIIVAVSQFAPVEMRTLNGIIDRKRQNEQDLNAEELFRAEAQRLRQTLRTTTKKTLLNIDEINQFLTAFDSAQGVFIQQTSPEYANRGDYFNRHQAITPRNCDPLEELQALKQSLIEQSALLGISPLPLQQINYSEALRARLPQQVSPLGTVESQQLEVEEEVEEQVEFEVEMELEEEQESQTTRITAGPKVASYLRRQPSETFYSAAERMHPAFDPKIEFSSAFLPLERRDILHRRVPFDDRMSRIGVIRVFFDSSTNETIQLGIGDLLDNIDSPRNEVQPTPNLESFLYDTRTARITWTSENDAPYAEIINRPEFKSQVAQIRFMDGQIDRYAHEDLTHLSAWLQIDNRAQQMRHFFEQKILQHRSEVRARYQHSQLWNLFEQLGTRTTIRTF